ncbi:hypothetical protein [Sulfurisphaera ohwakuensis]|uniref:hypothetical protein n=1 Tax=Sulfurisphaera ohwakuensis TaxID=69656 RepID=UPI0036F22EB6
MKNLVKNVLLTTTSTISSGVLLGLSEYLHSIDHQTWVPTPHTCPPLTFGCMPLGKYIPPPWYANLWPETLTLGLVSIGLTAYGLFKMRREIKQGLEPILKPLKTLYKKWYDYEFGWQDESPFKIHRPDEEA